MTGAEHDVAEHWEQAADAWIAWTRRPGHDAFWSYRDGFRAFLPPPGRATLEIGCGEGRIARELTELGHDVTAADLAPTMLHAARDARSARRYVRADAELLPFADAAFDRVIAYNVLMDVADMPAAVAEIGRVLGADGLAMPFAGWSHPLGDYVGALRDAGLVVVDLHEPRPDRPAGHVGDRAPLFCWLTARRYGSSWG